MICSLKTAAFDGIEAKRVEVQVSLGAGMPGFVIVGLPDKAINESKERVRAVLAVLGVEFPREHITVNLKPVDLLKEGAHFDLPIAMGLMGAMGLVDPARLKGYIFMGALSLDGSIERVNGVLPAAVRAIADKCGLVCPAANASEAAWSRCAPAPSFSIQARKKPFAKGFNCLWRRKRESNPRRLSPLPVFETGPFGHLGIMG